MGPDAWEGFEYCGCEGGVFEHLVGIRGMGREDGFIQGGGTDSWKVVRSSMHCRRGD